jgi:branched-chain amino acid transport system permease protein
MDRLIIAIVGGLSLGGIYALVALGFVFAYRATATVSLAHGQLVVAAAFVVGYLQTQGGWPFAGQLLLALFVTALIAAIFYRGALQTLIGKSEHMGLIATLGLASIVKGAVLWKFGSVTYTLRVPWLSPGTFTLLGARIDRATFLTACTTVVLALLIAGALRYSHLGTQVLAAGQDPILASQGGINIHRIFLGSWAVSGALAALAGVLYANVSVVSQDLEIAAFAAIPAIVIGGFDSIGGAVVGGIAVGILQQFVSTYYDSAFASPAAYILLLLVLLVRPQGLFGTKEALRV